MGREESNHVAATFFTGGVGLPCSRPSRGKAFPPHPHFHPVPGFQGPWVAPLLPRRPYRALLVRDAPKSCHPSATGLGSRLRRAAGTFRGPRSPVFRAASPYSDLRVRYFSYLRRQLFTARLRRAAAEGLRFAAFDCVAFAPCRLLRLCRTMRYSHIRYAAPTALLCRAETFGAGERPNGNVRGRERPGRNVVGRARPGDDVWGRERPGEAERQRSGPGEAGRLRSGPGEAGRSSKNRNESCNAFSAAVY